MTARAPAKRPRRLAVVGGGLSGMAAAQRLTELSVERDEPVEVLLFEASERLGGAIRSERVGPYLVEHGADMFVTDKPWARDLCKRLGIDGRLIVPDSTRRRSLVLCRGRPEPVPEGFMLMVPSRLQSILRTPILSPLAKLRMALEVVVPRGPAGVDESLADFVTRRLGREALERLVQPLVAGIYTSDPRHLSLRATLPRFIDMEQRHGSLILAAAREALAARSRPDGGGSGARYDLFVTLPGGMGELVDVLAERLRSPAAGKAVEIRLGQEVRAIERHGTSYRVIGGRGHDDVDGLILALPAFAAADLVQPWAPRLADLLGRIRYASSAIVIHGYSRRQIHHPLDAFGLVVPQIEGRPVFAVSFSSCKFPGRAPADRVLLRSFLGGATAEHVTRRSDAELEAIVRSQLGEMLGVDGEPELSRVVRYPRSMPQYEVGHLGRVAQIEAAEADLPAFALAGNGYRGVGIPDCIHSGELAATRIFSSS